MISDILERSPETQVVMVCGKNKELRRSLKYQFKTNKNVLILGYTHHMNEWMASADLMVTKPGGITISEALARRVPMIFLDPAPGQELENAYYFEAKGMGKVADTTEEAIALITSLTQDETALKAMSARMQELKVKYPTYKLCRDLLHLLDESSQAEEIYGKVPLYAKLFLK